MPKITGFIFATYDEKGTPIFTADCKNALKAPFSEVAKINILRTLQELINLVNEAETIPNQKK